MQKRLKDSEEKKRILEYIFYALSPEGEIIFDGQRYSTNPVDTGLAIAEARVSLLEEGDTLLQIGIDPEGGGLFDVYVHIFLEGAPREAYLEYTTMALGVFIDIIENRDHLNSYNLSALLSHARKARSYGYT